MKRRLFGFGLAAVLALGTLTGCGESQTGTEPGDLTGTATIDGQGGSSAVITATANAADGGNPEATTASGSENVDPDLIATAAP